MNKDNNRRYIFDIIIIIVVLLLGIKLLFPDILKPSTYNIYIVTENQSLSEVTEVENEGE